MCVKAIRVPPELIPHGPRTEKLNSDPTSRESCTTRDENGRKQTEKPHFYFRFYIFCGNGIGFGKYGYENGIRLRGSTETNQYGR